LKTLKIGVTGGIGSGKSLVCSIFELYQIPVYYADDRAKGLMVSDISLVGEIVNLFGREAYLESGQLNRQNISEQIFNDKELLIKLNSLVHPAVHQDVSSWFQKQKSPYAIEEAALIIESGNHRAFDHIILVSAPTELRIDRVMKRNNLNRNSVLGRVNNQSTEQYKRKFADIEIINDGKHSLVQQVAHFHHKLLLNIVN